MRECVEPFRAMAIGQLARELEAAGESVIHMEFGQPSTGAPAAALDAVRDALDRDPPGYWESVPLRKRIARLYRERHDVEVDPARILLTCGASPALLLALLARFEAGDRIAYATPGYVAYRNTTIAAHMRPVALACGADVGYQLTAEAIAALDPAPAGVIIAIKGNEGSIHRAREARYNAGNAVSHGLPYEAAIAALTVNPARIFGMTGQFGELRAGAAADVVVWSGDPLEPLSLAETIFVNGQEQAPTSRQFLLRDRYRDGGEGAMPPAYTR